MSDKISPRKMNVIIRIISGLFGVAVPTNVEFSEGDSFPDEVRADPSVPTLGDVLDRLKRKA